MGIKGSMSLPGWESTAGDASRTRGRLTAEQKRTLVNEPGSFAELAVKYGISASHVQRIKRQHHLRDVAKSKVQG